MRFSHFVHGTQLSVPSLPHQISSVPYMPACIGTRISFAPSSVKSHHSGFELKPQIESWSMSPPNNVPLRSELE